MALVHILGDPKGPGEENLLRLLEHDLPNEWDVVFARQIPSGQIYRDLDFIVVGERLIFVLEEKYWRSAELGDQTWHGPHGSERSPLHKVNDVCRVLATYLSANRWRPFPRVQPVVVLSNRNVEISGTPSAGYVLRIDDVVAKLVELDRSFRGPPIPEDDRRDAIDKLADLNARLSNIRRVGHFEVVEEVSPIGPIRNFNARDERGRPVVLRCYPMHGWGPGVDPERVVKREAEALTTMEAASLHVDALLSPFEDEARDWYVTPLRFDERAQTLEALRKDGRKELNGPEAVLPVAGQLFDALAEAHRHGVIHRGICPSRIRVSDRGVSLHDFHLSRLEGQGTIPADPALDDAGFRFRPPETQRDIHSATMASDVFSAAASVWWWVRGDEVIGAWSNGADRVPSLWQLIGPALAENPSERPSAQSISEAIDQLRLATSRGIDDQGADESDLFEPSSGLVVRSRYKLLNPLGTGSYGTTWRAEDLETGSVRTVKFFHSLETAEHARREFDAASRVKHRNCARVWDISTEPAPGFLVSDYIDGSPLNEWVEANVPKEEQVRDIALQLSSGLAEIHAVGLLHKDLHPQNVIVDRDGTACIIDFGLASQLSTERPGTTPGYDAPEVAVGRPHDMRSDLFSLGVTLRGCFGHAEVLGSLVDELTHDDPAARPSSATEVIDRLNNPKGLPEKLEGATNDVATPSQQLLQPLGHTEATESADDTDQFDAPQQEVRRTSEQLAPLPEPTAARQEVPAVEGGQASDSEPPRPAPLAEKHEMVATDEHATTDSSSARRRAVIVTSAVLLLLLGATSAIAWDQWRRTDTTASRADNLDSTGDAEMATPVSTPAPTPVIDGTGTITAVTTLPPTSTPTLNSPVATSAAPTSVNSPAAAVSTVPSTTAAAASPATTIATTREPTTLAPTTTAPTTTLPTPAISDQELMAALPGLDQLRAVDATIVGDSVPSRRDVFTETTSEVLQSIPLCDSSPADGSWNPPSTWNQWDATASRTYLGRSDVLNTAGSPTLDIALMAFSSSTDAEGWLESAAAAVSACQRWESFVSLYERVAGSSNSSTVWIEWATVGGSQKSGWLLVRRSGRVVGLIHAPNNDYGNSVAYRNALDPLLSNMLSTLA